MLNAVAKIDIKVTDKGLLIPRVALTNVTTGAPITSPANGLMYGINACTLRYQFDVTSSNYMFYGCFQFHNEFHIIF